MLKKIIYYFNIGLTFLISKKIIAILELCLIFALLGVSTGYKEELKQKEIEMIAEKTSSEIKNYTISKENDKSISSGAINELEKCYHEKLEESQYPTIIQENIQKLNDLYNENNEHFSFLYQDLYSGFTISYNEESPIFTASSIKAPAMIYLYEEAAKNKIDLTEKLTYTNNFYHGGSGVLQNKPQNTSYTIEELIKYTITESDNIAYSMLMQRYGRKNILNYWANKGTKNIFTLDTIWGVTSAKDASIYMNELYEFYLENNSYGKKLMDYFKNATWKIITNKEGQHNTANKGGWSGKAFHDIAIVNEKNPYILIIMSNTGESNYTYLFTNTSKIVGSIHEEYWKYKQEKCSKINQY